MSTQPGVSGFLADNLQIREAIGLEPATDSPADLAMRSFKPQESVRSLYNQAELMLDAAADNLEALDQLITTNEVAIAPWVIARAIFEACARAVWLLDRKVETKTRVGRSLALRFGTLRAQEKIANVQKDRARLAIIGNRMDEAEKIASVIGFQPLRKNGKRTGIAVPLPAITDLVAMIVKDENFFRILSGIAHSDNATLRNLFYVHVEDSPRGGIFAGPVVRPEMQRGLLAEAVVAFASTAWHFVFHYGGNVPGLEAVLTRCFDELGLNDSDEIRFWRSA